MTENSAVAGPRWLELARPRWPELTDWGNYRCRVADIEGYEWTFGTHLPGEPVSGR